MGIVARVPGNRLGAEIRNVPTEIVGQASGAGATSPASAGVVFFENRPGAAAAADVLYAQLGQTWSESDKSIIKYLYRTHSCPRHVQFHPQQSTTLP